TISGNSLGNLVNAKGGNDVINGVTGNDTLIGGAGNDTYQIDADASIGTLTLDESGGGTDTLDFSQTTGINVAVDLSKATAQTVNVHLTLNLQSGATVENVIGTALNDTLTGNLLNNNLNGGAGNDTYVFDTDSAQGSDTVSEA